MRDLYDTELAFVYGAGSGQNRSPSSPSKRCRPKNPCRSRGGSSDDGRSRGRSRCGKGGSS